MKMKKINELKGFEKASDIYYITSDGKVLSFKNGEYKELAIKKTKPSMTIRNGERVLKSKNEYRSVCIMVGDKGSRQKKYPKICRLVALAFVDNPNDLPQVDHINKNSMDDRAENLRWVTAKDNSRHSNAKKLYCYTMDGNLEKIYECGQDVKEDVYNSGHAMAVARGKERHHRQRIFSFIELDTEQVIQRLSKSTKFYLS